MIPARGWTALAAALVVAAVVLAVLAAVREPMPLPVVALLGAAPVRIAAVQGTAAVVVPPALVAVVAVLRATGRLRGTAVLWAHGAAAPIVLFLVARLNGVVDAVALVLVYASTAGGVLLRLLDRRTPGPLPRRLESVLGIVPWGVVAFSQIGGLIAGTPPPSAVRTLTVLVLAATVLEWVLAYRRRDEPPRPADLLLVALPGLLAAALVLLAVR